LTSRSSLCGPQDFASAMETDDNRSVMNSTDIIVMSIGFIGSKLGM
jgi:hypothetical protein